jgi:putative transcriptional regulator
MGARKLKIVDIVKKTGLSRHTLTARYKEEVLKVDVEALDKLCDLFECEVSDLLEHVKE